MLAAVSAEDAKTKNWTYKEFMDDSGLNGSITILHVVENFTNNS